MTQQRKLITEDLNRTLATEVDALKTLRNETIFISGATGFMGTWLLEAFAFLNDHFDFKTKVIGLSEHAKSFVERVPALASRSDIVLQERDVRTVFEIPSETSWVIHAAACPDGRQHASDPRRILDVIVNGTKSVLSAASLLPDLKKLINVSSGWAAGPQPLDMEFLSENNYGPVDCSSSGACYMEGKRCAETLCAAYRNEFRMPIVNVRPFAFVGPYQSLDRPWAINNFIRDGLSGGPIRIQGDGQTVRSYMYPADMVAWMLTFLVKAPSGRTYNLGSNEPIKLANLAELIASYSATSSKIEYSMIGAAKKPVSRLVPSIDLAKSELGLTLKFDLKTSIIQTLNWHKGGSL